MLLEVEDIVNGNEIIDIDTHKTPQQLLVERIEETQKADSAEEINKLKAALLKKIENGELPI